MIIITNQNKTDNSNKLEYKDTNNNNTNDKLNKKG